MHYIIKIESRENGKWEDFFTSKEISIEELSEVIPDILKPSTFGREDYRVVIETVYKD